MDNNKQDNEANVHEEEKSRSQIKRDMQALQDLGKQLTQLNKSQLSSVPMSTSLNEAIELYNNIFKNEGKRRQLQYIGKLMRREDESAIREALAHFDTASQAFTQALHETEAWRDKLLTGGKPALTEFISLYPNTDIQALRQGIRIAQRDLDNNKNTGAGKKLFRLIKTCIHPNSA